MHRIRLIHWDKAEAEVKAEELRAAGYDVDSMPFNGPPALRAMRENPPAVAIIDLSRSPSMGRDLGVALRHSKGTRHISLVFVEGDPEKTERIRKLLPDAVYTPWNRIRSALEKAIASPPSRPVVPDSVFAGYSDTPLPKKLGIKANSTLALINAPPDIEKILGQLPKGVTIRKQVRGQCDLVIWFTASRNDLEVRIENRINILSGKSGLWIAWPKKTSGMISDLSQNVVREVGLRFGLVDYKVCAIDETWSGLLFSRRNSRHE